MWEKHYTADGPLNELASFKGTFSMNIIPKKDP